MPNLIPVTVPVPGTTLPLQIHGELITMKPIVEHFGLAWQSQLAKLRSKSWAVVTEIVATGTDGKTYTMIGVDRRTLTMWLATLPETRVRESIRAELIAYQREAADALDAYFHQGAAVNPRAELTPFDVAKERLKVIEVAASTGLFSREHLAARAELILGRAIGERPEIPAQDKPVYVEDYMRSLGLAPKVVAAYRGQFGKDAKAAYKAANGHTPPMIDVLTDGGKVRQNAAYTAADTPFLEHAYAKLLERHPEVAPHAP